METSRPGLTGVKKRQQIQQANKTVFIWVSIAAVVVTIAIVLAQFMVKQFIFNNQILGYESTAADNLKASIDAYEPLKKSVANLTANQDLTVLRVSPSDNAVQVVIDAMPTVDDRIALAASLQQVILARSGAKIDGFSFMQSANTTTVATANTSYQEITFGVQATGPYDTIRKLLDDIHHSLRPISVTSLKLSGASSNMQVQIQATTYYALPRTADIKTKTITPEKK